MNIEPGIGVGPIKYGITEDELKEIFGKPDKIEEEEYVEGTGDWHKILWYSYRNIYFTFNEDDNYRLGTITIMGTGFPLLGKELFGLPIESVKNFISKKSKEIPKHEDHSWDIDEPHECLIHNGLGIMFWFDSGKLSEMQCSYLFEADNETIIWP